MEERSAGAMGLPPHHGTSRVGMVGLSLGGGLMLSLERLGFCIINWIQTAEGRIRQILTEEFPIDFQIPDLSN